MQQFSALSIPCYLGIQCIFTAILFIILPFSQDSYDFVLPFSADSPSPAGSNSAISLLCAAPLRPVYKRQRPDGISPPIRALDSCWCPLVWCLCRSARRGAGFPLEAGLNGLLSAHNGFVQASLSPQRTLLVCHSAGPLPAVETADRPSGSPRQVLSLNSDHNSGHVLVILLLGQIQ